MSEKTAKNVFLYSHEYRDEKMWGQKTHETIFPETNEQCEQKMLGKKSSENSAKNVFLYSQEYREKKCLGKIARINFSRNTRIVLAKNVGEKIFGKK